MRWMKDAWFRLRALFGRERMERELEEEIAFHLEREAEKLEREGMSPREARRIARVRFGGVERQREAAREAWGVGLLTDLAGDLRFALRQLRKNPTFSALAALTLALGIGGTVALGSAAHGILLRPGRGRGRRAGAGVAGQPDGSGRRDPGGVTGGERCATIGALTLPGLPAMNGFLEYLLAHPIFLAPVLLLAALVLFAVLKRLLKIATILAIAGVLYILLVEYVGTAP